MRDVLIVVHLPQYGVASVLNSGIKFNGIDV